ncbi:MAG: sigma-54-dependent Fis family transcriptional regulator [Deltaproteobacteria bacterium]|nr:MAG: sigma-54-dependent Fis family transcriptional regulator [Deltaproteobacteria bacterium]
MSSTILVVDDEALPRKNIARVLEEEEYHVYEAENGDEAIKAINDLDFDLVLCDLKIPGTDGRGVLRHVRSVSPQTMFILMTGYASLETAIEGFRGGVHDYILKPVVFEDVLQKVKRLMVSKSLAWEVELLRRQANSNSESTGVIGESCSIREILATISKVAPTGSNVLITGESGVGKEVVARTIHLQSPRKDKVFLPVNCSGIPETLLESQLFGHVKGAFTDAATSQEGLFQRAQGGTIFLDEIGEMALSLQPKILRVIEDKEVLPIGSTHPFRLNVRMIAATNRELEMEVAEGRFREDLFYRLNVINIRVPPLRERREDIPLLVDHSIRRHNAEMKRTYKGVDNAALKLLMSLPWKGNVRELDNVLELAMILGDGEWITPAELPQGSAAQEENGSESLNNLRIAVQSYEKSHIENVLKDTAGDKTRAAELLGVSRSSLYRKMESLGIHNN